MASLQTTIFFCKHCILFYFLHDVLQKFSSFFSSISFASSLSLSQFSIIYDLYVVAFCFCQTCLFSCSFSLSPQYLSTNLPLPPSPSSFGRDAECEICAQVFTPTSISLSFPPYLFSDDNDI